MRSLGKRTRFWSQSQAGRPDRRPRYRRGGERTAHPVRRRDLLPSGQHPDAVRRFVANQPVWVHVDWDVLEPGYIPAAYKIPNGLLPHQVAAIFAALPTDSIRGVELAEFEAGDPETPEHLSMELILETFQPLITAHPAEEAR